jgi:hypothetical protein
MHSASGAFLPDADSKTRTHINPDRIASGLGAKQVRCEEDLSKTDEEVRELICIALQESWLRSGVCTISCYG